MPEERMFLEYRTRRADRKISPKSPQQMLQATLESADLAGAFEQLEMLSEVIFGKTHRAWRVRRAGKRAILHSFDHDLHHFCLVVDCVRHLVEPELLDGLMSSCAGKLLRLASSAAQGGDTEAEFNLRRRAEVLGGSLGYATA